ncbi:MAG: tetratricopeptide repeat protein [Myxococcales bacterium]|nr:tetratricopeptide repeat protein [Myxococcales bacterium]
MTNRARAAARVTEGGSVGRCVRLALGGVLGLGLLACASAGPQPVPSGPPAPTPVSTPAKSAAASPLREEGVPSLEPCLREVNEAQEATRATPDETGAWLRLATALHEARRLQEAARAAWRAVELEARFETWSTLGRVLTDGDVFMAKGAAVGAYQAYTMAARNATDAGKAARNFLTLAYRDFSLGHDDQALELIEEAGRLAPSDPLVPFDRAQVLSVAGRRDEARAAAEKALTLLDTQTQSQTPADPALAGVQAIAAAILGGEPVARPGLMVAGELLPERFWARPPVRGHSLALEIDPETDRFFPLLPTVALRLAVPTTWAHAMKATDKAIHLRLAAPEGEAVLLAELTVFPLRSERFDLRHAAEAGRQGAAGPRAEVSPLRPVEREKGLAYWFSATDGTVDPQAPAEGQHRYLWQAFAYVRPFVLSATFLANRQDAGTEAAVLALLRSFDVFALATAAGPDPAGP